MTRGRKNVVTARAMLAQPNGTVAGLVRVCRLGTVIERLLSDALSDEQVDELQTELARSGLTLVDTAEGYTVDSIALIRRGGP